MNVSPTIPAATATARSARARPQDNGSQNAKLNSCRFPTITSSSPCRLRSGAIAFQNTAAVYDLLFRTAAETLTAVAADPRLSFPLHPPRAISNSRLIALDQACVTFKWKDYRIKGRDRLRTMTLDAAEFIRRFLLHVLPGSFHRIRHYGLFAGAVLARNIERARQLLAVSTATPERSRAEADRDETPSPSCRCPRCGGRMIIVETFEGPRPARSPSRRIRIDTS